MTTRLLIWTAAVMLGCTAHAGISYSTFADGGLIPDNSPVGSVGTATASGFLPTISAITVNLNISGGYNGDLYACLSYGGVLVPLLTRVGTTGGDAFGYGDTGFNITLSSGGAYDVHLYGTPGYGASFNGSGQLTGTWQPDGRALNPSTSLPVSDSRVDFSAFNGLNPNGTWTLLLADLSSGQQSQMVSWSLGITAVPEPVNVGLGIFAGAFLVVTLVRSRQARKVFHQVLAR
jgi:hypothetical protein